MKKYLIREVQEITGLDQQTLITFVQREWICPVSEAELDDEDLARVQLIQDLQERLGVNDEAVPLILHLIDQLCCMRARMKK